MANEADNQGPDAQATQLAMQAAALRLSAKLQAFYDELPDDERTVMSLLMRHFASSQQPTDGTRAQVTFLLDTDDLARRPAARPRPAKRRRSR